MHASEQHIRLILAHMRRAPLDYRLRVRAAEQLIGLGRHDDGMRILRSCVDSFTLGGFPLRALWTIKLIELHQGPAALIERGYQLLARHYARAPNRQWGDPIFEMPTPAPTEADLIALPLDLASVVAEVGRRANDIISGAAFPDRLPRFPLLSDLEEADFLVAARAMILRRLPADEVLLAEGEVGDSVHIVAAGQARVTRLEGVEQIELGRIDEGEIFGEMALVTDSPRIASVVAATPIEVLALQRTVLTGMGQSAQALLDALARRVCDRMVGNLMQLSPVFKGLNAERRGALITRFRSRLAQPGEAIITEGERAPGLFIVLDGRVQVSVLRAQTVHLLKDLREGDVFGEISLIRRTPATATCTAERRTMLMWLPTESFNELRSTWPEVVTAIEQLGEYRLLDSLFALA